MSQGGRYPSSISDSALPKVHTTFAITQGCGPAPPDSPSFVHFKGLYSRLWPWKVKQLKTSIECTGKQNPENKHSRDFRDPFWHAAMGSCKSVPKTHSEKWLASKGLTQKGLGSLLLSLASVSLMMDTLTFTFCGDLAFFLRGRGGCQGLVPWPHSPLAGSNTHLRHFKMELATAWHWKMHVPLTVFRLAYVCSDTVSEAEVYISPLLLFGCYRAINVKSNTLK